MRLIWRRFTVLDLGLLLALCALGAYLSYRINSQLNYVWNWGAVPQFLLRYDDTTQRWTSNYLLQGLWMTLRLSVWASALALALGLVMALARLSSSLYLRLMARSFIELMRNLPPLVIIFLFYFFLAEQLIPWLPLAALGGAQSSWGQTLQRFLLGPQHMLAPFLSAVLTLAVFESAYAAEILRAGIASIHQSQWDASQALGLTRGQTLRHVIVPQALRRIFPPLAGQLISLIKDSTIVSVISIQELTYQGQQLMASTYLTLEVWITVALLYFLLTFPCSVLVERLNRRLNRRG